MSLPVKLGVGTLALGSAVGLGYGAVNYFSETEKTIEKPKTKSVATLIKEKYEYILLNFSEDSSNPDKAHWNKIWEDYKRENNTDKNPLELNEWAQRNSKDLSNQIKQKCSQFSTAMILNEQEQPYKDVTKYCSRPVTLKDEASNSGLEVIDASDGKLDDTTWKTKFENKTNLQQHFNTLKLTDSGLTATKVREKCKSLETKVKQDREYQDTLPAYKEVCANRKR